LLDFAVFAIIIDRMPRKSKKKQKKNSKKQEVQRQPLPSKFKQDIAGILLLALALFIFVANLSTSTGLVGFFIVKTVLRSALGVGVLVLPFFVAAYGIILLLRHEIKELAVRLTGLSILFITYISTAQFYSASYFADADAIYFRGAGGLIGYGFHYAFTRTVGVWGSYIILSALVLIGALMIMNVTLVHLMKTLYQLLRPEDREDDGEVDKNRDRKTIASQLPILKNMQAELEVIPAPPPDPEHRPIVEFPLPKFETESESESSSENKIVASDALMKRYSKYKLPPLTLLDDPTVKEKKQAQKLAETTEMRKKLLEDALRSFGVGARVVSIFQGPAVTRYEVQPEPGVKVSRIANLADDIALNLAASGVRIEAPVPGKSVVGIEVPNAIITPVKLKEIVKLKQFQDNPSKLCFAIGKDLAGQPIYGDLSKMPHLLIAGTTGSGKSVCINSLITSILLRAHPDEVKMLMIDPKMVELSIYNGIAHLLAPVVTEVKKAAVMLKEWVISEMERRYRLFRDAGARNLHSYNQKVEEEESLPYIVVIIDELADLMMVAANEVEGAICRIAQLARATGIHLVIATQRPSVDVITGLIKANVPSRIAFAVATQIDSRVILDSSGAEKLLGRGDMLYNPIGAMKPTRAQGTFVTDKETEKIIKYVKDQAEPEYVEEIISIKELDTSKSGNGKNGGANRDALFGDVAKLIISTGQASTSYVQRKFRIGYNRAARLMDEMEEAGIVSPPEGENKPRRIIGSLEKLTAIGVE
jgi:DNA segregation ATPase FtsK/SpoIIIE, S-DNA-T family